MGLYGMIKPAAEAEDDDDDDDIDEGVPNPLKSSSSVKPPDEALQKRAEVLRNKLKFVSKMMKMNKTLREQNETIVKIKNSSPDAKIPHGLLSQGKEALSDVLGTFNQARKADLANEKRPMPS